MGRASSSRQPGKDQVWIVHPVLRGARPSLRTEEGKLAEAKALASSIELDVVRADTIRIQRMRPSTLIGSGVLEGLAAEVRATSKPPALFLFNADLTPIQQRNLERELNTKVLDRTSLILEIFGARASTHEGSLQVELAHLHWQQSRLVRSWTHLERQRGGFGFLGGPGESQIEIDRRLIAQRIVRIRKELERVRKRRSLHRRSREHPVVALVGYTNAGKSTLFSRLTGEGEGARAKLFATLDPLMRSISLPSGTSVILSDTVGFVSELPTTLVAAFRATLEEVVHANLLIHVRDVSHPEAAAQREDVEGVLATLEEEGKEFPLIVEALNKIDLVEPRKHASLGNGDAISVSAATGEGVERLLDRIDTVLSGEEQVFDLALSAGDGATLAWLYRKGAILHRKEKNGSVQLRVRLNAAERRRFEARFPA